MSSETLIHETLARAAGALLSLAFSYIPGLGARYAAKSLFVSSFLYSIVVAFSDEFPNTLHS
jgi:hypothetical protein